jgi:hypothetical protein
MLSVECWMLDERKDTRDALAGSRIISLNHSMLKVVSSSGSSLAGPVVSDEIVELV